MTMATELLKDLDQKVVKDGESWVRLRSAFSSCISQFGNGAYLSVQYIGGQSVSRDFKTRTRVATPSFQSRCKEQRGRSSSWSSRSSPTRRSSSRPPLLRKLMTESWQDSRYSYFGSMDYPIYGMIQSIQEIVLDQCLDASVLGRIQNQELQSNAGTDPIKIAEIFRASSTASSPKLPRSPSDGTSPFAISTIRRNLEREYVKRLSTMVLGPKYDRSYGSYGFVVLLGGSSSYPPDAKNLARLHLDEIGQKIDKLLEQKTRKIDDTTLAHLKELRFRIDKVLKAGLNANEP